MHDMGADIDQGDVLVAAVGRKRRRDHHERFLGGVRLDVHDPRPEPSRIGDRDPVLHLFLARGRYQDFDFLGVVGRRSKDLEIEIDLVQRKGDVLVRLGLDLELQLFLALARRNDDFLGNHHCRRQRHGDIAISGAKALVCPAQRLGHLIQVGDIAVGDHILGKRLDGVALESIRPPPRFREFHHLERRRANIDAD